MLGFKALLAWHYLVLFTPMFIGDIHTGSFLFFFERQLALYFSLGVSFGILAFVGKLMLRKNKTMPSHVLLGTACALATFSTLVAASLATSDDVALRLASTVFLGASEALLMFLWLHYYAVAAGEFVYRSFATDMICGGLVAFLICIVQEPFSYIMTTMLPLVAGVSLIINWYSVEPQHSGAPPPALKLSDAEVLRSFLKAVLPTLVYGFVFGFLQGGFILNEVALLMAYDPLIILGILVCGALIFATPEDPSMSSGLDAIHRFSLFLFVLGVVFLAFFGETISPVLAETAIFAGFNLFDFGAMILALGMSKRLQSKGLLFIEGGRALVYLSLALGVLVGEQLMLHSGGGPTTLYTLSGIAIALLVVTSLTPFREIESLDARLSMRPETTAPHETAVPSACADCAGAHALRGGARTEQAQNAAAPAKPGAAPQSSDDEVSWETPWRRTCHRIAKLYKLSPRETEIFFLIAKGRNAEYIQNKLVISTHTAKTHIANIYHKLGVHSSQEMLSLVEDHGRQGRAEGSEKDR